MKVIQGEPGSGPAAIQRPATGVTRGKNVAPAGGKKPEKPWQQPVPAVSFEGILAAELERAGRLKLSAHAERRLMERNVILNREDMRKIEGAVQKAAGKGSRESLVIYGDLALVASVKNLMIITALEGKDMQDHVFTNIDSAVIIR